MPAATPPAKKESPSSVGPKHAAKKAKPAPTPTVKSEPRPPHGTCVNAALQWELAQNDSTVLAHPVFSGVLTAAPTGDSGVPAYDKKLAASKLGRGEDYVASCPWFWLNANFELQPNVPKYKARIEQLEQHFFASPRSYPDEGVTVMLDSDKLPHELKGQLKAICPPELRDAFRCALARAVKANEEHVLKAWLVIAMSIPFRFKPIAPEHQLTTVFRSVVQRREDIGVLYENLRTSSLLRSYEVVDLRAQLEPIHGLLNKNQLAEYYEKTKFSPQSEIVKSSFVEVSVTLHNGMLKIPAARDLCFQFDGLGTRNPLDSVHKLREISAACTATDDLVWTLQMMWDWWNRTDGSEPIPIRVLQGKAAGWGGKRLIDLFIYKRTIRNWLLRKVDTYDWNSGLKARIRTCTDTVMVFRATSGFYDDPAQCTVDTTERAAWPESADKMMLIFDALVFGYKSDEVLKTTMKNKRSIDDLFASHDVAHFMEAVKTAYDEENKSVTKLEEDASTRDADPTTMVGIILPEVRVNLSAAEVVAAGETHGDVDGEAAEQAQSFYRAADRRVRGVVKLVVESATSEELGDAIKSSSAGKTEGSSWGGCTSLVRLGRVVACAKRGAAMDGGSNNN